MTHLQIGLCLGLTFGSIACLLMLRIPLPDKRRAMAAAFADRFAAGTLLGALAPVVHPVLDGVAVALLVSMPGAIVTGKPGPILAPAVVFGALSGLAMQHLAG